MPALPMTYVHTLLPRLLHRRSWMHLPVRLLTMIVAAQRRARERQQLAEMDAAQLTDIGLTEADRLAELGKAVWRR